VPLAHAVDVSSFFDLQRVCHCGLRVCEVDHIYVATHLANDENVIFYIHERGDIRTLRRHLSHFLEVFSLVDEGHTSVASESHSFHTLGNNDFVDR